MWTINKAVFIRMTSCRVCCRPFDRIFVRLVGLSAPEALWRQSDLSGNDSFTCYVTKGDWWCLVVLAHPPEGFAQMRGSGAVAPGAPGATQVGRMRTTRPGKVCTDE